MKTIQGKEIAAGVSPPMFVNLANHYWAIGGSTTEVYASRTNTMVPSEDADYAEWASFYGPATNIGSEAELADVLRGRGTWLPAWLLNAPSFIQPAPDAYDKDQLKAYSANARWAKQRGGIVVNGIPFPTDSLTLGALNSAMLYTSDRASDTFSWKLPDGSFITLDSQGVKDLQNAVSEFGQRCFDCEDQTADAIDAGTITNLPAIDAAYAAVSNEFTSAVVQRREK